MLTVFWDSLDIYTAKTDIIGLIDTAGCLKLTFIICCAQNFLIEILGFAQMKVLKIELFQRKIFPLCSKITVPILRFNF